MPKCRVNPSGNLYCHNSAPAQLYGSDSDVVKTNCYVPYVKLLEEIHPPIYFPVQLAPSLNSLSEYKKFLFNVSYTPCSSYYTSRLWNAKYWSLLSTTWCEITLSHAQRSTVARTRVREKSRILKFTSRDFDGSKLRYSVTQIDYKDNIVQTNKSKK